MRAVLKLFLVVLLAAILVASAVAATGWALWELFLRWAKP